MKASNVNVQIEVESDQSILVVLDRRTDAILIRWQDAFALAETLELAIADARNELDLVDTEQVNREQAQIRLGIYGRLVSLVFEHADRIRYHWPAAVLLATALRIKAQDLQYAERSVPLPTLRRDGKLVTPARLVR